MPQVGIVIGSESDRPVMEDTLKTLEGLGVDSELVVASAHRDPERVREYVQGAPGLPVIGVPLASSELKGVDALYAIAQMTPGVRVACVAVGAWGARNAALLAAEVLGIKYAKIRSAVEEYRQRLRDR